MLSPPSSPPATYLPPVSDYNDSGSISYNDMPSSPPLYQETDLDLSDRGISATHPNIDMLIRSASSLLSIFNGPCEGYPPSPSRTVRSLSRIAMLFVEDSSAITAVLAEKEAILVRIIQEPSYSPSSHSAYPNSKIGPDWLIQCCL